MALTLSGNSGNTTLDSSNGLTFSDSSNQQYAASPYGLKNRIINGDMRIDQRNAGSSVTITNNTTYTLDRWIPYTAQSSKFSVQQQSSVVPTGFTYATKITSLSAYTPVSGDYFSFNQRIEGYNIADLAWGTANAKTITISFWVYSSLTGTFGGAIGNDGARSYPFSYTISSANTWEQKTVTITGDTSGSYNSTNGSGITLRFGIGAGSSFQGTAGSWSGGDYVTCTGATNVVATNGATFYITGVQLEIGSTATPFERRLYNQELANCQRYYYKITSPSGAASPFGMAFIGSTTAALGIVSFPVSMRTQPLALEQSGSAGDYRITYLATTAVCSSVPTFSTANYNSGQVVFTVASGLTAGQASSLQAVNTNGYLAWSAEL